MHTSFPWLIFVSTKQKNKDMSTLRATQSRIRKAHNLAIASQNTSRHHITLVTSTFGTVWIDPFKPAIDYRETDALWQVLDFMFERWYALNKNRVGDYYEQGIIISKRTAIRGALKIIREKWGIYAGTVMTSKDLIKAGGPQDAFDPEIEKEDWFYAPRYY